MSYCPVPKVIKTFLLLLPLLVVAFVAGLTLTRARREPYYQGRPLSHWIHEYRSLNSSSDVPPEALETATNAISHIGTNGLPFLLHWMEYEPGLLRDRLTRARDKQRIRGAILTDRTWIPEWVT